MGTPRKVRFAFAALLMTCGVASANFFLDSLTLLQWLDDYEAYQERREIRYMAKASQYVGYVTGVADAQDGTRFCLPGGVGAEQTAAQVAEYARQHAKSLPRHASETVVAALAEQYPCKR
jgi:hypothetical protein